MEEIKVTLYLKQTEALALAQFVKRLDKDSLARYAAPAEQLSTEQSLHELAKALTGAVFNPR